MSKNFEKQMARILPKQSTEQKVSYFEIFKKEWYLDWWFPKLIYVLGFIALLWKLFDIIILGRWL